MEQNGTFSEWFSLAHVAHIKIPPPLEKIELQNKYT